jgi:hypothetical protein
MADQIRDAAERPLQQLELHAPLRLERAKSDLIAALAAQSPAPAPASDGEREELVAWLNTSAKDWTDIGQYEEAAKCDRAATLLRNPAPATVPLTLAQLEKLQDVLCTHWDEGPPGEVWASREVDELRAIVDGWLSQPPQGGEVQP